MTDQHDHNGEHDAAEHPQFMRRIRSFVLREGRMTPAQQRAFDDHWARFGIDYTATPQDYATRYGRSAPLVLEIGFGNGEALAWASENDLSRDFIGVEVHGPGVGRLMNALAARDATNVRLYKHDAVEVLENEIHPARSPKHASGFPTPGTRSATTSAASSSRSLSPYSPHAWPRTACCTWPPTGSPMPSTCSK